MTSDDQLRPVFEMLCERFGINPNHTTESFQNMIELIKTQSEKIEELEDIIGRISGKYGETKEAIFDILRGKDPNREMIPDYIIKERE